MELTLLSRHHNRPVRERGHALKQAAQPGRYVRQQNMQYGSEIHILYDATYATDRHSDWI